MNRGRKIRCLYKGVTNFLDLEYLLFKEKDSGIAHSPSYIVEEGLPVTLYNVA